MPSQQEQFAARVNELLKESQNVTADTARRVFALASDVRKEVLSRMITFQPGSYTRVQLDALLREIDRNLNDFAHIAGQQVGQGQKQSWDLGIQMVDQPLAQSGLPAMFTYLPAENLVLAQGYSATLISGVSNFTKDRIAQEIQRAVIGGKPIGDIVSRVSELLDGNLSRAEDVVYNETGRIQAVATHSRLEQSAARLGKDSSGKDVLQRMWLHFNIGKPREGHVMLNGTIKPVNEPFTVETYQDANGQTVASEELMYPHDPSGSMRNTINCFLPGTVVQGRFISALKTRYSGPVIEIHTRHGVTLRVTANHPIITARGWVRAEELDESDYLIRYQVVPSFLALPDNDKENPPASIEDLFYSLRSKGTRNIEVGDLQLHGDAPFTKGEIEHVGSLGKLLFKAQTPRAEFGGELSLTGTDMLLAAPESICSPHLSFQRVFSSAPSRPRLAEQGVRSESEFGGTAVLSEIEPATSLSLGAVANLNVMPLEKSSEGGPAHAEFLRKLIDAGSGQVFLDHPSRIRKFDFSGHIYDAQTETGWIVANGLFVSNCHCRVVPALAASAAMPPRLGNLQFTAA